MSKSVLSKSNRARVLLCCVFLLGLFVPVASGSARASRTVPTLERTLPRKDKFVRALAYSPDSRILAVGGGRWEGENNHGAVHLWNVKTGQLQKTLWHKGLVSCVVFSPNGRVIASGDFKGNLCLWNAGSGKLVRTLVGHSQAQDVSSLAFSSDSKLLAVGAGTGMMGTGELRLLNVQTGKPKWSQVPIRNGDTVESVAFSLGNTLLAEASLGEIKLRDVATGAVKRTIRSERMAGAIAFSADGKLLAQGSAGGKTADLWDVSTGKLLRSLKHPGVVWTVAFAPRGRMLATGTYVRNVRLWDAQTGKLLHSLSGQKPEVQFLDSDESDSSVWIAFSPNAKTLAVSDGRAVKIWRLP